MIKINFIIQIKIIIFIILSIAINITNAKNNNAISYQTKSLWNKTYQTITQNYMSTLLKINNYINTKNKVLFHIKLRLLSLVSIVLCAYIIEIHNKESMLYDSALLAGGLYNL